MSFKRAIGPPTKAQQKRQDAIRELGCVACWLDAHPHTPCEIQHMNNCGRNMGQDYTFGLCPWHHRGVCALGYTSSQMMLVKGPSFAKEPRLFHERYGSDLDILEKQNMLLTKFAEVCHATQW